MSIFEKAASSEYRLAVLVLCILLASVSFRAISEEHSQSHTYLHQSIAFTKGRVWIDTKLPDVAEKDGRYYVAFPPFPSIVLMPFAYLQGVRTRTLLITPFLGALVALFAFRLARRIGGSRETARWATVALVFGTSMLLCLRHPVDTYLAQICAVLFSLISLHESFGRQRGLLLGFTLGFAILSRQATIFLVPLVWTILLTARPVERTRSDGVRACAATLVGLGVCAGFYLYLNAIRFGSPLDFGYEYIAEGGWYGYRAERWGNFNWIYIPSNLIRLLFMGFEIDFLAPSRLVPQMGHFGTSLTFASPFVFYAFRGRFPNAPALNRMGLLCIVLTCLVVLSHKSALGGWQINGLRYTLDFMPMLFVFIVLGLERAAGAGSGQLGRGLILYSIALNFLAIVVIPLFNRVLGALVS